MSRFPLYVCSTEVKGRLKDLSAHCGRPDVKVWSRADLLSPCFPTTSNGGSNCSQVVGRLSVLTRSQRVIEASRTLIITRDMEHARVQMGKSDLTTYLLYVSDPWDARRRE